MMLLDMARRIAPADVAELVSQSGQIRAKEWELDRDKLPLLREQLELALSCLRDHVQGDCPQIPYFSVALLAAAVSYFGDELDLIPDFLPRIGRLDDALVMAMAFQLAEEGVRRYAAWKGHLIDRVLHPTGIHGE